MGTTQEPCNSQGKYIMCSKRLNNLEARMSRENVSLKAFEKYIEKQQDNFAMP